MLYDKNTSTHKRSNDEEQAAELALAMKSIHCRNTKYTCGRLQSSHKRMVSNSEDNKQRAETSVAVAAETSLRSPRKKIIFIIKKIIFRIKVSNK